MAFETNDYDSKPTELNLIKIPFRILTLITALLVLFSFLFCIIWSLVFDFEEATSTHCRVSNYLPSISAAIGGFVPQKYVWRIGIALHAAPRFLVAFMYRSFYKNILLDEPLWKLLGTITCALHMIENACLVGLTYIGSSEYYPAHEKCFVTFVICALTYMLLSCSLPRIASRKPLSIQDFQTLQVKSLLTLINIMASLSAVFFFVRHNNFCEQGMYTLFALSEYIVVLSNIAFHLAAYWDFHDFYLTVGGIVNTQKTYRLIPP